MRRLFSILLFCGLLLVQMIPLAARPAGHRGNINVVVTIKPVHSLVAAIMKGIARPALLIKSGSPHSYALKPSGARKLQQADLVIRVSRHLEEFLQRPLHALAGQARQITLDELPGLRPEQTGHHGHPPHIHIWLDPVKAQIIVREISAVLAKLDPGNAAQYQLNGKTEIRRLQELGEQMTRQLAPVTDRAFLTWHDAWRPFAERFHLKLAGSIAISPERQPGVRHLQKIQAQISRGAISCIFTEPSYKPGLAAMLVENTSARLAVLDPLGTGLEKGPELYFTLMRKNVRTLLSCLGEEHHPRP